MDISEIISKVSSKTGLLAYHGNDERLEIDLIPFGIPQLDFAIGGGLPRGRIIILEGDSQGGKTFLSQLAIRGAQRKGLSCVYHNCESKFDPSWFARSGVDLDKLVVVEGNIMEGVYDAVISLIEGNVGMIVIDSLAALVPASEADESMMQQFMGLQARVNSRAFRNVATALSSSNTTLVCTNQKRSGIGTFSKDFNPGGNAPVFYASMILNVRRRDWIENGKDNRVGFRMAVRVTKNNVYIPWKECEMPFYFTRAEIDLVESVCELAVEKGIIEKGGSWFTYGDTKIQGLANMVDYFKGDNEAFEELSKELLTPENVEEEEDVKTDDNEDTD